MLFRSLRTFNCGIGMVILASESDAGEISQALKQAGESVYELGHVIETGDATSRVRYLRS